MDCEGVGGGEQSRCWKRDNGVKGKGVSPAEEKKKRFLEWAAGFFRLYNVEPSRKEKLKTDHYNMYNVDKDPAKLMCDGQDFVCVLCCK
jgi:hypothetical protein